MKAGIMPIYYIYGSRGGCRTWLNLCRRKKASAILPFKWNKLMLAVHLLRLETTVYGLLTVYLIYLTGRKVFGEDSRKPLLAVALVGLNPMFAHISNSIVNINLGILLFSLFFYLAAGSLSRGAESCSARRNFVLGLIAGAAYLSKITGLVLIPIWGVYILLLEKKVQSKFSFILKSFLFFTLGFIITAGWYLARNLRLYGSLLETSVAINHFGRPAMQLEISGPINYWTGFIQTNFRTFFSGYGMLTVNIPNGILFLLLIIIMLGFWGMLIRLTQRKIDTLNVFLILSGALIILGHLAVNINVEAFHARDLFIGMVPFSLLLVDGWSVWLKQFRSGKLWSNRIINSVMFLIFLVVTSFYFIQPTLVDFIKIVLSKLQILSPATVKLIVFTAIFYIFWITFKSLSSKIADVFAGISTNKKFLWILSGGLFLSNILILLLLVIPRLYQL